MTRLPTELWAEPMPAVDPDNPWTAVNWQAIERLRRVFLSGEAGRADYWQDLDTVRSYDLTFAQRIAWKWQYVLEELARRHWQPPGGELFDWGCGSGVAGRMLIEYFGITHFPRLAVWDRSPLAARYAARRAAELFPGLDVRIDQPPHPATLVLSHVLNELSPEQLDALLKRVCQAQAVLWVEPGTHEVSRSLIEVRERLRGHFNVVAPCVHQETCDLLRPEQVRHWCHHFAPSPPEVFTDPDWARFANVLGIDLRSLPVSFLVLDRRAVPAPATGAVRVVGRPRVYKAHALLFGCDASGVRDRRLDRRQLPDQFRQLKKGHWDPLQRWELEGERIHVAQALEFEPPASAEGTGNNTP